MDHWGAECKWAFDIGAGATMRKKDAWGKPILRVGDVVTSIPLKDDPGTVIKILQVNANGPHYVAVKWFTWDNSRTTEERVSELDLVSKE